MRTAVLLITVIIIVGAVAGAYFYITSMQTNQTGKERINAATLLGGISTLDIMENQNLLEGTNYELNVLRLQKTPDIIAALTNGEADVAVIPAEMAAKLIETGNNIVIFSVEMMQNQAILTLSSNIRNVSDLVGKKVGAVVASGTYKLFKAYMEQIYNLTVNEESSTRPDAINVVNVIPGSIIDALINGDVDAVVIWEPFVSKLIVEYNATIVADFESMWRKYNPTLSPVMLVWVARGELVGTEKLRAFMNAQMEAARIWNNSSDIVVNVLIDLYNLDNRTATYLYNRVHVNTNPLNQQLIESIRAEWHLAWLGGYLTSNPDNISDDVFIYG